MTIQYVNVGAIPNDGNGDKLREAFVKINSNFAEVNSNTVTPFAVDPVADTLLLRDEFGNGFVNKIYNSNVFATTGDLPPASTYPGMFVCVTSSGHPYYSNGTAWIDMLYKNLTVTSYTGGSTNEKGSTVATVNLTWIYSGEITSQTLTDSVGLVTADRAYSFTGLSLTTNKTYTLTAGDGTTTVNANAIVAFSQKRYWGASALTSLTTPDILALTKEFSGARAKAVVYDCTGGKYPYYCYPTTLGNPSGVVVGGFAYSDYTVTVQSFTNASGFAENYNVVRFNGIQTGSAINVVWN